MRQEFGSNKENVGNPHNFYKPLTEKKELIVKLNRILKQSKISNKDLFESIADTYTVNSLITLKSGEIEIVNGAIGNSFLNRGKMDMEIYNKDIDEVIYYSYYTINPGNGKEREECSRVELSKDAVDELIVDITLTREIEGSVDVEAFSEENNLEFDKITDGQKSKIVKMLLYGNYFEKTDDHLLSFNLN